jgi:hypothetical protein
MKCSCLVFLVYMTTSAQIEVITSKREEKTMNSLSKQFYNKTCNSQIKKLTQCWFWLLIFSWFHTLPIFPSISQPEMVKYVKFKIAGYHLKKILQHKLVRYYIWMEVGINHSNYPDVAIKPRSEMPLMHSRCIRLCRISITCHMKITIINLQ